MKKLTLTALLVAFVASVANAGYLQPAGIYFEVGDGYRYARGDLTTVAYSDDPNAFIGCGTRKFMGGPEWAFCQAGSSDEATLFCTSFDPGFIDAVRNLSDTTFLGFSASTTPEFEGECVYIATSTQSFYQRNWKETGKRKNTKDSEE